MQRTDYGLLTALAGLWGLSYVFYRVGAPALGPALFVDLRVGLASAILLGVLAGSGRLRPTLGRVRAHARAFLIVGLANSAVPFSLIAFGELTLPASYSSILNATAPMFSVLFGAALLGRAVPARQVAGVVVGVGGVAVLVGAPPFPLSGAAILAIAVTIGAAASYGLSALYVQERLRGVGTFDLTVGPLLMATAVLVPFSSAELPNAQFTRPAILAVLGIAVLSTSLAYLIYFRILKNHGATSALAVTFLMPIFGVAWGALLLGEAIGLGDLVGIAVILSGVALVTGVGARKPEAATPAAAPPGPRPPG
jgi:drug/metabolite transporter (DMT)-like permease